MIVFRGWNADGNRHTHMHLPLVLAGNGGKSMRNLFLSFVGRMGVGQLSSFWGRDRKAGRYLTTLNSAGLLP